MFVRFRRIFVLLLSLAAIALVATGCDSNPHIDWEERYHILEDEYSSFRHDVEEVFHLSYDSGYACTEIAYKLDTRNLLPPYPVREDMDAILDSYIGGERYYTRSEAYLAHDVYKAYADELENRLREIEEILSGYYH